MYFNTQKNTAHYNIIPHSTSKQIIKQTPLHENSNNADTDQCAHPISISGAFDICSRISINQNSFIIRKKGQTSLTTDVMFSDDEADVDIDDYLRHVLQIARV